MSLAALLQKLDTMSKGSSFDDEIAQSRSVDIYSLLSSQSKLFDASKLKKLSSGVPTILEKKGLDEGREGEERHRDDVSDEKGRDVFAEMEKSMETERIRFNEKIKQLVETNLTLATSLREAQSKVESKAPELQEAKTTQQKQVEQLGEKDKMIAALEKKLNETALALQKGRDKRNREMDDLQRRVTVAINLQTQKESELSTVAANSEKLYETLKDTQQMLDDTRESNAKLTKTRKEQESEITTLKTQIAADEQKIKTIDDVKRELKSNLDFERNKRTSVEKKLAEQTKVMGKEVEELTKNNQNVYQSLKNTQQLLDDTRKSNGKLNSKVEKQRAKIVELNEQLGDFESDMQDLEEANSELVRKFDYALKKNASMQVYLEEEKDKFCSEISYWKSMNEQLYESLSTTKEKVDSSQKTIRALELQDTKHQATIAELATQIIDNENQHAASKIEQEDRIAFLERQAESLQERYSKVTKSFNEHRDEYDIMVAEKIESQHTIKKLNAMIDNLNNKVNRMRDIERKNEALSEQVHELTGKNKDLTTRNTMTRSKFEETTKKYRENYYQLVVKNEKLMEKYESARKRANERTEEILKLELQRETDTLDRVQNMPKGGVDMTPLTLTKIPSFTYENKPIEAPKSCVPFLAKEAIPQSVSVDSLDGSTQYDSCEEEDGEDMEEEEEGIEVEAENGEDEDSSSSCSESDDDDDEDEDDDGEDMTMSSKGATQVYDDSWFWEWMEPSSHFSQDERKIDVDEIFTVGDTDVGDEDEDADDDDEEEDETTVQDDLPGVDKSFDYM